MAEASGIQWLQRDGVSGATWNPWISCAHATYIGSDGKEHVHPGCLHCYAENLMDTRYGKCRWGSNGNRVMTSPGNWKKPATWNRKAQAGGYRMPVFPSLCDPFEDWAGPVVNAKDVQLFVDGDDYFAPGDGYIAMSDPATLDDIRRDMFGVIDSTPHLDWILFTKRPQNVRRMWVSRIETQDDLSEIDYRQNVTLCYSASNQETLNYGVPLLLRCTELCQTVGISLEPMLGPVKLSAYMGADGKVHFSYGIDCGWIIIGCESNGPRVGRLGEFASEGEWWDAASDVVRQCKDAGVPVFMKQGPRNGRVVHDLKDFPESCRVREFPENQSTSRA